MEPTTTTLAASAIAFLSPYLVKAGTKAAEEVGKQLPVYVGKVWTAIADKFKGRPAAEEAVQDLLDKPEDEDNQASLRKELRKVLESDAAFAESFAELLRQAQSEAKSQGGDTITVTGGGAVATGHGRAVGQGGNLIEGDVHGNITMSQSKPSS